VTVTIRSTEHCRVRVTIRSSEHCRVTAKIRSIEHFRVTVTTMSHGRQCYQYVHVSLVSC